jgi:hypothetical protein
MNASAEMITKVHALWNATIPSVANVTNLTYSIVFQSVLPVAAGYTIDIDPASEPEKTLALRLLSNFWSLESDSPTVLATTRSLLSAIQKGAETKGAFNQYVYLNYAASWQEPLASYGEDQLQQLRVVSRKV